MKSGYILLEDKLNQEYKAAFDQVEMYSETHLIGEDVVNDMMMELLDHMLEAQEAGLPVSDIVGDDVQNFAENFFSEYTAENRLKEVPGRIYRLAWVVFVFELVDWLIFCEDGEGLMGISDIGGYMIGIISAILIDSVVFFLIRPLVEKNKNMKPGVVNGILFALFIMMFVLACIFSNKYSLKVQRWLPILLTGVYIGIFMTIRAVKNYKTYGSVKAPKQETISFREGLSESMKDDLPKEWLKQYRKKNKKRARQGKDLMTNEEFMEQLDRQYNYRRNCLVNISIFSGCSIIAIIGTAIYGGFETTLDVFVFIGILIVIEGCMCRFFNKSSKKGCDIFHSMKEKMDAEGLTFEEYVEDKENS